MAVTFDDLWRNHPSNESPPDHEPCQKKGGGSAYDNQCVIRLGEALTRSGVDLSTFRGAFCWHGHAKRHPLRVEQFMKYIDSKAASFAPDKASKHVRSKSGHQVSYHTFLGRTGIVAFMNFWGAGNRGDHIDLWNDSKMAKGDRDYFERSEQVWFWPIK